MKRLVYAKTGYPIGDYPEKWEPPEESDMAEGLKSGEMRFIDVPDEPVREVKSVVDRIVSDPDELEKLKQALK